MDESGPSDNPAVSSTDDEIQEEDFGTQLQHFYIALRGSNPYDLADAMCVLEHTAYEADAAGSDAELASTMQVVVADCRKKCAQVLRSKVADAVSSLLSTSRKKLRAKISLDSESSSLHNQRHLNCMLDLLGAWSDIVAGIVQSNVSYPVKSLVIAPFHNRVLEVSFECFEQFKSDKNISSWLQRVSDPDHELNLVNLDVILAQLAGMRELTMQYQSFLMESCALTDIPLSGFDLWKELDVVYCALDHSYNGAAMKEAIRDSRQSLLLCVEDGRPVFVLQGVEDAFFVIRKGVDRAISTGSDVILFSVMNRMMDLLGYEQEDIVDGADPSSVTLLQTVVSNLPYYLAISKHNTKQVKEAEAEATVSRNTSKLDLNESADETFEMTEAMINNGTEAAVSVGIGLASAFVSAVSSYSQQDGTEGSTSVDSTVNTVSSFVGAANGWFMGLSEIAAPMPEGGLRSPAPRSGDGKRDVQDDQMSAVKTVNNGGGRGTPAREAMTPGGRSREDLYTAASLREEDVRLSVEDAIVRLNTLGISKASVHSLQATLGSPEDAGERTVNASIDDSPSGVIRSELARCHTKLKLYGDSASTDLAHFLYDKFLLPPLRSVLMYDVDRAALESMAFFDSIEDSHKPRSYEINASQFDHLSSERRLREAVSCFFDISATGQNTCRGESQPMLSGMTSRSNLLPAIDSREQISSEACSGARQWTESRLRSAMTSFVFAEFLGHMAVCVAEYVATQLFKLKYSEWGAMLMHQEVMSIIQCFDIAVEGSDVNMSNIFRKLKGLLKILTLHQPADVLRYTTNGLLPSEITEEDIRRIMKQRADFSKEAVERMKISIPQTK